MTQANEKIICLIGYIAGKLHTELKMIREDLHMGDTKAALVKVNDALKTMDDKTMDTFPEEILEDDLK